MKNVLKRSPKILSILNEFYPQKPSLEATKLLPELLKNLVYQLKEKPNEV
jgi:hypothetical protein